MAEKSKPEKSSSNNDSNPEMDESTTEEYLCTYMHDCREEADQAKQNRMRLNEDNYDMFQLLHDFSHKEEGQSTEILSKQRMAVEQTKSFFQQALADIGEWFGIEARNPEVPEEAMLIKPHEASKLLAHQHVKSSYFSHVGNSIQSGLLGALIITKTTGKLAPKPKYTVKSAGKGKDFKKHVVKVGDKTWEMCSEVIRQRDFYPDPTGKGLYTIEEMYPDLHEVKALATGPNAIYDMEVVEQLSTSMQEDAIEEFRKNKERGQNTTHGNAHRPKVKIEEFWGTVIDRNGNILHENVVYTIANDKFIIRKPTPNPLWHQKNPYTVAPLLEVNNAVWPIALMDAATKHNRTLIEIFNLTLDAAFKQVHAPSQIRTQDLVDPTQISDGIPPGTKLQVKSSLPPGARVMEPLEDVKIPPDSMNVINMLQQEFNSSALTNDLRQGVMPFRQVKATEVVEASQTITSVFQGVAKNIESKLIEPELQLQWMTLAQNWDDISKDELTSLFGQERGTELSQLAPQDVFVASVNGYKFKVFGISQTLSKAQDFRKLTTLLQTIGGSDVLIEEFIKKYDFGKLLGEIMVSLDIDHHKIKIPETQQQPTPQGGEPAPAGAPGTGPINQDMSQVPSAGSGSLADVIGTPSFPSTNFAEGGGAQ